MLEVERPAAKTRRPENAKKVFSGVIFDVYQWDQEMFDGTTEVFEALARPDTVVIVPVTTDGQVVMIKEEQPGVKRSNTVPLGRMNAGEAVELAAARELMEETGYKAEYYSLWLTEQPITKIDWAIYVVIAHNCVKVAEQNLDAGERIEVLTVSVDEFLDMTATGAMQIHELEKEVLRAKLISGKLEEVRSKLIG